MNQLEIIKWINQIIAGLFFLCYFYQLIYIFAAIFKKIPAYQNVSYHRFAILISARNEEAVIAHLIESIKSQDYPAQLISIFVVADNCTDHTAAAAKKAGAIVYERENRLKIGKGYALQYLLAQIEHDYGDLFDGFFVFDADNLLMPDYISQMNKTFSSGYSIVTSYRNSKNFGSNWISAGYALWFMRESKYLNQARMALGTSCAVSGTGFLFSKEILKKCGGWEFFLLTEDIEFTVHNVIMQEKIGYCPKAELFDEQPVHFSQSWNQRLRWAKGYLQVYKKYGTRLFRGIFRKNGFACFDMTMATMPAIVLSVVATVLNLSLLIRRFLLGQTILPAILSGLSSILISYFFLYLLGLITLITEWKKIHTSATKKILYSFTFPVFMMTYIPISFTALFKRVTWKPIEHKVAISLEEMREFPS